MFAVLLVVGSVVVVGAASPGRGVGAGAWPSFLYDPTHTSFAAGSTAITPVNAGALVPAWAAPFVPAGPTMPDQPEAALFASPTVSAGRVFIGSNTGMFYAVSLKNGHKLWGTFLGYQGAKTCAGYGVVSTATVATDAIAGETRVYVAAGDGYLYALDATSGAIRWQAKVVNPGTTQNVGMNWSSPTVLNGRIYVGMSSNCDHPLIRGGVRMYEQNTGQLLATHYTMGAGQVGGSVWSTGAASQDGTRVFVTTGNAETGATDVGQSYSIVALDPVTLSTLDIWTVPPAQLGNDSDFGASPNLWTAGPDNTPMVGACNKNSVFYAMNANDLAVGPVWKARIGVPRRPGSGLHLCLGAGIFDGSRLYVGGPLTKIDGTSYAGSMRSLDPATGAIQWETGLDGTIEGSPSMNGGGVIAAGGFDSSPTATTGVYLLDASDGSVLGMVDTGSQVFAQPTFSGTYLLVATVSDGLMAFKPPA